jgi:hypothetical protein
MHEEPAPMMNTRAEVPESLERLVQKVMQKNPESRYQSFQELLAELKSIIGNIENGSADHIKKILPSDTVLPFVKMSADSENEYFSDGLAEDLINALSKIKTFRIAARTSTFSFKDK